MSKPDPLNYAPPPRRRITLWQIFWRTGFASGILLFVIANLTSPDGHARLSHRSGCFYNLNAIVKAMNLYANDNSDHFPIISYAPYSAALNNAAGRGVDPDPIKTFNVALTSPYIAGSPTANLWLLVLNGSLNPKQFICKNDPTSPTPSPLKDSYGRYLDNFQSGVNNSYSFAYPWDASGKVSPAWTATIDSSIPIVSDVAPLNGTGSPSIDPRIGNSINENGEGQNVAFADTHVEFDKTPNVGQSGDNIWTLQSGPPSALGLPINPALPIPFATPPATTSTTAPTPTVDTIMLPIRNATTGAF